MGDLSLYPPCCLANGYTEGDHDPDCDDHPLNRERRAIRLGFADVAALIEREAS